MARLVLLLLLVGACTDPGSMDDPPDAAAAPDQAPIAPPDECEPPPTSLCSPANPGSVVRGVARFDASHFEPGKKVGLALFLNHQVPFLGPGETLTGGHPHAFKYLAGVDVTQGHVSFSIDLCELGTAMYSEENCGFNLVAMLDEDGSNDPDATGETAWHAQKGELVAMVPLDISCHTASPCLDLTLACVDGESCTTYQAPPRCACASDACPSDNAICRH